MGGVVDAGGHCHDVDVDVIGTLTTLSFSSHYPFL